MISPSANPAGEPETPSDTPVAPDEQAQTPKARRGPGRPPGSSNKPYHRTGPTPTRAARYGVLPGGDFRVFRIAAPGDEEPEGTLCAIPGLGGFESTEAAMRVVAKAASGEDPRFPLERKLAVVKVCRIVTLTTAPQPRITIMEEPRRGVTPQSPRPPDQRVRPEEQARLDDIERRKREWAEAHAQDPQTA